MANIPISALPYLNYTSYLPTDLYPVVNSGVTYNTTLLDLQTYVLSGISTSFTGNTSATCINDLYVDNLHGCNDLTIVDDTVFLSNITANTITINDGQKVRGNTSNAALNLKDPYGVSQNTFSLTSDNGGYANGAVWLFGGENYYLEMAHQLTSSNEAIGFGVYSSGTTFPPIPQTGKEVTVHDNKGYSVGSGDYDKAAVFVGTRNSTMDAGIVNSVVIGGQNLYAQENDTVYVDKLNINTVYTGTSLYNLGIDSNGFVVTGSTSGGSFTGGTVPGETIFTGGLSATTFSATTIGISGNCVSDLYVYNIHSCSPLNINPNDEGDVYFGSTSAITISLSDNRIGVGTSNPTASVHIKGEDNTSSNYGLKVQDSGNTDNLVVRNDGNVGIGGQPTYGNYKLQVLGNAVGVFGNDISTNIVGSQYRFGNSQRFQKTYFESNVGIGSVDYYNSRIDYLFDFYRFMKRDTTEIMRIGNFGSSTTVGIGTASATARLQVKGDGTGTTNAFLVENSSLTELLSVRNDGRIFLNGTCNVGFGSNPNGTLYNVALGVDALDSYTGASNSGANVAIGFEALKNNLSGQYNVAVGYQSLVNTTSSHNTSIGYSLIANTSGIRNTAVGYGNLNVVTNQNDNMAVGVENLRKLNSGTRNTAIGSYASMYELGSGSDNTAVGYLTMSYIGTGSNNTIVGSSSLSSTQTISGSNNTIIGGSNFSTYNGNPMSLENNTVIGQGILNWSDSISNHIVIGDGSGNIRIVSDNTGNVGIGTITPTAKLDITGSTGYNQLRLRTSFTPSGSTDTSGNVGDIAWDDTYFYWKTNGNGWLRVSGSTW